MWKHNFWKQFMFMGPANPTNPTNRNVCIWKQK